MKQQYLTCPNNLVWFGFMVFNANQVIGGTVMALIV
jgi:hypothetical protein